MQNLVFKGLNGQFKIVAATQYITRIKDSTKNTRLALPDNRNFVLSIHVAGVVLKSLKINEVGGKTIY